MEYFGWHPERTYEQFQQDRLALCYGGADRAALFLKLLHNTAKTPEEINTAKLKALETGLSRDLDIRQRARWTNLAAELARRQKLAESLAEKEKVR